MRPTLAALALAACHPPWPLDDSATPDTGDSAVTWRAPEVAFVRPAEDGAAFWEGANGTFEMTASDGDGDLDHIALDSDVQGGLGWAFDLGEVWAFDASLQPGEHRVTATAVDAAGHEGADDVSVTSRACGEFAGQVPCRWTFDASLAPLDEEPNANEAWTCAGGVFEQGGRAGTLDLVDGVHGQAPRFEGDGRYLATLVPTTLGPGPWTLLLWFKGDEACETSDGGLPLLTLAGDGGDGLEAITFTTAAIEIAYDGTLDSTPTSMLGDRWSDGAWHLFALQSMADGYLRGYLDGSPDPSFARFFSPSIRLEQPTLLLGTSSAGDASYCGALDDLTVSVAGLDEVDLDWTWRAETPFCLGTP